MPPVTVCVDNSVPPRERRVRVRYPLSALAYLDIGADNGGIILNVSEEGLALQAVGPLEQQKEIDLRIQLPHTEERIETAARIVWLSRSNRQAGVRFASMPAQARAQMQRWMNSQPASGTSEDGSADDPRAATVLKPAPGLLDSQREKWLGLMADFAAHQSAQSAALGAAPGKQEEGPAPVAPISRPRPEIVSRQFGKWRERHSDASPIETAAARLPVGTEPSPAASTPGGEESSSTHGSSAMSKLLAPQTAISGSTLLAPSPAAPAKPEPDAGQAARTAVRRAADAASRHVRTRNRLAAVAGFALFSILCFGVGTWVGRLINHRPAPQASIVPSPLTTAARTNTGPAPGAAKPPEELRATSIERRRSERPRHSVASGNNKRKPAAALETAFSASSESPRPNTSSLPLGVNPASAQPVQSVPNPDAMQPAPVDFVTEQPATRVVDGHVLRPSDRFNPCHLTYQVQPSYPLEAQQQGVQGTVKIHLVIAADGSVRSAKLLSGPPQLASAALDAAKYWRFFPALLNGQPVQTEKDVEVPFHLPR